MSFVVFAWIASIVYSAETIVAKLTSKYEIKNPWFFNFLWAFFISLFTLPVAYINHAGMPREWVNILIASFFSALVGITYIFALQKLDISVFSPLFNFRSVFTAILGALLLGEILTFGQYLLIALIFLFGILVSLDEKFSLKSFFRWPIFLGLAVMMSISLMSIYIKRALLIDDFWTVTVWIAVFTLGFMLPTIYFFVHELKSATLKQIGATGLLGSLSTIGILASNKGFEGNVSISSVIISLPLSMVIAFLFSVFAPKLLEKHSLKIYAIRFISVAMMIWAALKLST